MVWSPYKHELLIQVRCKEGQPNSTYLNFKYKYIQFLNFISRNLFFTAPQPSPLLWFQRLRSGSIPTTQPLKKHNRAGWKSTLIIQLQLNWDLPFGPRSERRQASPRGLSPLRGCGWQRGTAQRNPETRGNGLGVSEWPDDGVQPLASHHLQF